MGNKWTDEEVEYVGAVGKALLLDIVDRTADEPSVDARMAAVVYAVASWYVSASGGQQNVKYSHARDFGDYVTNVMMTVEMQSLGIYMPSGAKA